MHRKNSSESSEEMAVAGALVQRDSPETEVVKVSDKWSKLKRNNRGGDEFTIVTYKDDSSKSERSSLKKLRINETSTGDFQVLL